MTRLRAQPAQLRPWGHQPVQGDGGARRCPESIPHPRAAPAYTGDSPAPAPSAGNAPMMGASGAMKDAGLLGRCGGVPGTSQARPWASTATATRVILKAIPTSFICSASIAAVKRVYPPMSVPNVELSSQAEATPKLHGVTEVQRMRVTSRWAGTVCCWVVLASVSAGTAAGQENSSPGRTSSAAGDPFLWLEELEGPRAARVGESGKRANARGSTGGQAFHQLLR